MRRQDLTGLPTEALSEGEVHQTLPVDGEVQRSPYAYVVERRDSRIEAEEPGRALRVELELAGVLRPHGGEHGGRQPA